MYFLAAVLALSLSACSLSSHTIGPLAIGRATSSEAMEQLLATPGPIELQSINTVNWKAPLSGLINLKSAAAIKAGLTERDEPIQLYLHVLSHPTKGHYFVDTGASRKLIDDPGSVGVSWMVRQFMKIDQMKILKSTTEVLQSLPGGKLSGVLLTHMHLDHIAGLPDIAGDVPIYIGPTESSAPSFIHAAVQGTTNRLFAGKAALQEWPFQPDPQQRFAGIVDVFEDGSVFALSVPGHTPGSTAYLIRSTKGPVLLTGDSSHTRWGWENEVEPGSFTEDGPRNLESLKKMRELVKRFPSIEVRFGHQL
jgi:N-acyl homoserine lactone hydrolase